MARYRGRYGDEEDDYSDHHIDQEPTDVGSALSDQVKIKGGKIGVFGWEVDVGPQVAEWVRPFVTWGLGLASTHGAAYARKYATNAAAIIVKDKHAGFVGKAAELTWLFGVPLSQIGFDIKRTWSNGFKDMNKLRDEAQPILAANNNMDVSVSGVLTSKLGVIADARARVWNTSKRNLNANLVSVLRVLPNIVTGAYQSKLNDMKLNKEGLTPPPSSAPAPVVAQNTSDTTGVASPFNDPAIANNPIFSFFKFLRDPEFKERFRRVNSSMLNGGGSQQDYRNVINDLSSAPLITDALSGFIERRVGKDTQKILAWDKIMELQEYVERHGHKPDRDRVVALVQDVFQQRAIDLKKKYSLEGKSFDEATEAVANAIVSGLHPLALAEILDNKKIVSFDAKDADFGERGEVRDQLSILQDKYTKQVSEKQFYKTTAFTKESLKETFKGIPEEEKPFFVTLFPTGILEKAGIKKEDVKKYRKQGEDYFVDELTNIIGHALEEGHTELKAQGVHDKTIEKLETLEENMRHGGIKNNLEEAKEVARDIVASSKDQQKFWANYLQKRGEEEVATTTKRIPKHKRGHKEFAERDAGDESGLEI